jgi:hypothetical protein
VRLFTLEESHNLHVLPKVTNLTNQTDSELSELSDHSDSDQSEETDLAYLTEPTGKLREDPPPQMRSARKKKLRVRMVASWVCSNGLLENFEQPESFGWSLLAARSGHNSFQAAAFFEQPLFSSNRFLGLRENFG